MDIKMDKDEIRTILACLRCQRETQHRITYSSGVVKTILCEECRLEIKIDPIKLLALYGEDLVKRVLTKPGRITEEYEKDFFTFFLNIPFRIATKPYRMFKEIRSLKEK
ncbi:MAG TPA: hypothetical protein VLH40_04395 [Atribacteraceae bacterium]|nr:hypothetical protein [Atribacteraceae bacterium]